MSNLAERLGVYNGPVPRCADCGTEMRLKESSFGKFYSCRAWSNCRGALGAYPDGRPRGIPANVETRALRIEAHAAFDSLWRSGKMSRNAAYRWLQKMMSKSEEDAHISCFNATECRTLLEILKGANR